MPEVVEDAGAAHARGLGNVVHGRGLHAALGKELRGRVDQRPTRVCLLAFPYAHHYASEGCARDPLGQRQRYQSKGRGA